MYLCVITVDTMRFLSVLIVAACTATSCSSVPTAVAQRLAPLPRPPDPAKAVRAWWRRPFGAKCDDADGAVRSLTGACSAVCAGARGLFGRRRDECLVALGLIGLTHGGTFAYCLLFAHAFESSAGQQLRESLRQKKRGKKGWGGCVRGGNSSERRLRQTVAARTVSTRTQTHVPQMSPRIPAPPPPPPPPPYHRIRILEFGTT